MGLSIYNIKKWTKMFLGKSVLHVKQDLGQKFSPGELNGYFNNLTEKVKKDPAPLLSKTIPKHSDEKAGLVIFPVAIFQYGLGAYDLYLETQQIDYLEEFFVCTQWAVDNQENNGAWNNFGFLQPEAPYGSMCQGEGCSLLLRAWKETKDKHYLNAAKKAIDFMLLPLQEGGTTEYGKNNEVRFYEFTNKPCVLNGWIFSIFGLYDLTLVDSDSIYKSNLENTLTTLKNDLFKFDNGFWSMYDMKNISASPFYHNLHISQLNALSITFKDDFYALYASKFEHYKNSYFNRTKALIVKALQKIKE